MRKKIQLAIYFLIGIVTVASAQYTQIPDANFEAALSAYDDIASDGQVPTVNIASLTTLNIANKSISSLSGIEDFTSLTQLTANGNSLTSVDLSSLTALEELVLFNNQITSIDLTNNVNLIEIDFYNNQLTSLDLSQNTAIVNVYIDSNSITSLDFSSNTVLKRLDVSNNSLTSFNLKNGNNTNISNFGASGNTSLTCILVDDVSYAESNFTNLDSGVRFTTTSCNHIAIPDANFEAALAAYDDIAADGLVTTANIESLTSLDVSNSSISSLEGIEYFTSLTQLTANGNSLTSVDISALTSLEKLILNDNLITSIDLTNNTNLTEVDFYNNQLTTLDLSQNTALVNAYLDSNSLESLDVTNNTAIKRLDVSNNALTSLNIKNGNNTNITNLSATGNANLTCILVDDVSYAQANFTSVDAGLVFNTVSCDYVSIPDANFEAALEALGYDDISGDGQVPLNLISSVTSLYVNDKNISDATGIEGFTALENLYIFSNSLTSLDLSQNLSLQKLHCHDNQLTALDLTNNTLLTRLVSNNNQIASIDLTQNTALDDVDVSYNPISKLDLSTLSALKILAAEGTNIPSLDLSNNPLLEEVYLINGSYFFINLKNGANTNILDIELSGNTNLTCISIDDVDYATTNWKNVDSASVFTTSACTVSAYTSIPDSAFEERLLDLGFDDISGDGQAPTEFIQTVTSLDLSNSGITDLTGISAFTSLQVLNVSSSSLSTLDLSGNTVIKEIYAEPTGVQTVNVSNMTALEILHCNSAASLSTLTLTGATSLRELSIYNVVNLTDVDVSTNTALEKITSYSSSLTNLNTTGATSLKEIQVHTSNISSLDLSTNTALEIVNAHSSSLASININGATALKELYVYQTNITELDASTNTALNTLYSYSNSSLASINVSGATALTDLQCYATGITSLVLSTNTNLSTLYCQDSDLISLEIKNGNTSGITNFNAEGNTELSCIMVDDVSYAETNFTNIDAGVTFSLTCGYTYVPDANFEAALSSIDDVSGDGKLPTADIETITLLRVDNKEISDLTGIEAFTSLESLLAFDNNLTTLDLSSNTNLVSIALSRNSLTSIDLSQNSKLETVFLTGNNLTAIDLSALTSLKTLNLSNTNLSSINLSQNTSLESFLMINVSGITEIDISQNVLLKSIDVSDCSISEIDTSKNTALEEFYLTNNNLTSIDFTNNPLMRYVFVENNPLTGYLDLSDLEFLQQVYVNNCDFTAINLKNGNYSLLEIVETVGNDNLTCIQVDDATDAATKVGSDFLIDDHTSFNEDCGYNFSVSSEVILEGAFELSSGNIIMHDNLRDNTTVLIPTTSPYNSDESCEATVFDTTGENAVVDWVELQLRNASDATQIETTRSALLLRNGSIVDTDGTSPVVFSQVQGDFYLAIAHRNHLTVMSSSTHTFSSTATTSIDFTNTANVSGGSSALISLGDGYNGIPLGDIDENGQIQNADITSTVLQLGISGYSIFDVDMNGQVQNADINFILQNIGKGEQF